MFQGRSGHASVRSSSRSLILGSPPKKLWQEVGRAASRRMASRTGKCAVKRSGLPRAARRPQDYRQQSWLTAAYQGPRCPAQLRRMPRSAMLTNMVKIPRTPCFQRVLRPFGPFWTSRFYQEWGTKMRYSICLAALAASIVAATPAAAQQATATADAKGIVLQSLKLQWVSDLDFGTVAPDVLNPGTVSINADTGARTTGGSVVALPGAFSRARFDG